MAGGRHNDEAGSSNPRKPFWELLEEMESQDPIYEPPADEEMDEAGDASSDEEMEDEAGGHEDDSTTDGGRGGETTDGGSQGKKARKDRNPITVGLIRQEFTAVDGKGVPTAPKEFAVGYANQVSAILRNTVTINTGCLKAPEQSHYRELLFRKLHARYVFPGDEEKKYNNNNLKGNPVNKNALKMMTRALARWKNRVRTHIFKKEGILSYEELVKKEPMVTEEDYKAFVARCQTDAAIAKSTRGKELNAMNIGTHRLGSGGYRTAIPKWEKEDAAAFTRGEAPPFAAVVEPQAKNFLRARCAKKKGSSSYSEPSDQKVQEFIEYYVSPIPQMKSMNCILIN